MGQRREDEYASDAAEVGHPLRIALISTIEDINDAAMRFIVLQLNTVQTSIEFEFVPHDYNDNFLATLRSGRPLHRQAVEDELPRFYERQLGFLYQLNGAYGTSEAPPMHFALLTTAKMRDNFFLLRQGRISMVALGNWRRWMAPPSAIEFILTLVIVDSVARLSPRLRGEGHIGTKGCIGDFAPELGDARQQVLSAFLCQYCRNQLLADGRAAIVSDVEVMIQKKWIGSASDPSSPAGIVSALGYDLLVVKGLRPTILESLRATLHSEGWKQLIGLIAGIALAALLVFLGLK